MFGSSRVMFNKKACFYWAQKIIHWVFAAVHGAAGGFNLLIYFFPEGSVTSAPPTQTSQALLAAGGTEQDSLVEQGKKKKKELWGNGRWSGKDEGRYSVWATFVHYRLLRGAARERRAHDGVRERLGYAEQCESRQTLCRFLASSPGLINRAAIESKLGSCLMILPVFFFLQHLPDQILFLMSAWLHPLRRQKQGIWLLLVFFCSKSLSLHANSLGNTKISSAGSDSLSCLFGCILGYIGLLSTG